MERNTHLRPSGSLLEAIPNLMRSFAYGNVFLDVAAVELLLLQLHAKSKIFCQSVGGWPSNLDLQAEVGDKLSQRITDAEGIRRMVMICIPERFIRLVPRFMCHHCTKCCDSWLTIPKAFALIKKLVPVQEMNPTDCSGLSKLLLLAGLLQTQYCSMSSMKYRPVW